MFLFDKIEVYYHYNVYSGHFPSYEVSSSYISNQLKNEFGVNNYIECLVNTQFLRCNAMIKFDTPIRVHKDKYIHKLDNILRSPGKYCAWRVNIIYPMYRLIYTSENISGVVRELCRSPSIGLFECIYKDNLFIVHAQLFTSIKEAKLTCIKFFILDTSINSKLNRNNASAVVTNIFTSHVDMIKEVNLKTFNAIYPCFHSERIIYVRALNTGTILMCI